MTFSNTAYDVLLTIIWTVMIGMAVLFVVRAIKSNNHK